MKKSIILVLVIFILPVSLCALDFGLITNVYTGYGSTDTDENLFEFKADILPRLSFLIGDNADFYLSAGLSLGVDEDFYYVPELLRTEFNIRFGNAGIKVGRMNYSDPFSFILCGLLDGAQFNLNSAMGKFTVGAWYTGLLYKKNVNINMTDNDFAINSMPIDYNDFFNSYFASKRMIMALEWDHPSIGEALHLNAAAICQIDLADSDQYNNQYFIFKAGIPVNSFLFELGGGLEFSQSDNMSNMAFAGDLGVSWMLPTSIISRLSFNAKIAGGKIDDTFDAFTPVTTKYFGNILKHKMSGLSVLSLDYSARLAETFGLNISALYFVRNDLGTFSGYPLASGSEGYFLGPEVFARMVWSPLSDLQFNLGGGAFLPVLGDAGPGEKIQWRVELTAILAIF